MISSVSYFQEYVLHSGFMLGNLGLGRVLDSAVASGLVQSSALSGSVRQSVLDMVSYICLLFSLCTVDNLTASYFRQ